MPILILRLEAVMNFRLPFCARLRSMSMAKASRWSPLRVVSSLS